MGRIACCGLLGLAGLVAACSSSSDASNYRPEASSPAGIGDVSKGSGDSSGTAIDTPIPEPPSDSAPSTGSMGSTSSTSSGASAPSDSDSEDPAGAAGAGAGTGMANNQAGPGILTAGAWDDNRNFDRFLGYRSGLAALELPGLLPITEDELRAAHTLWTVAPVAKQTLDISLIIDTTGSMGDEIAYLQSEFSALSATIAMNHPDAQQRWSLVLYKDTNDIYVTRYFDFGETLEDFRKQLATASAGGGDDYPESPEKALEVAQQLHWRADDATAKLAFWVTDAPHHDDRAQEMADAIRGVGKLGVHVYPVAASGVDELAEVSMRTAAELTGGRYLFLTNDSGVGGAHKEPTIPCYFVTKLDVAIERMVDIELSGQYREPDPSEVLRTGGNPQDGACTLDSGESVLVF